MLMVGHEYVPEKKVFGHSSFEEKKPLEVCYYFSGLSV